MTSLIIRGTSWSTFCNRTALQRQAVKLLFEEKFGEPLADRLKAELGGDFEECVLALMDVRILFFFGNIYAKLFLN